MTKQVITRFAPSPTGHLHLGGARTALFSWLYAKSLEGKCLLRIEDTDRERSKPEYTDSIINSFKWMGITFDEDIVYQSHNLSLHKQAVEELLAKGDAYHCHCSQERLEKVRADQQKAGEKPKYDGKCRELGLEVNNSSVVRFKNPEGGSVSFSDIVKGDITILNSEMDDLVILRSNGTPTYNLSVVVDDMEMGVTHVIRGDDHINNTPRQINITKALGGEEIIFGHVPMILGEDGKRMSKRHGALGVDILQGFKTVDEGTVDEYSKLLQFVKNNDLLVTSNYTEVQKMIETRNFINFWIHQLFYANHDVRGNIRFWRCVYWRYIRKEYDTF